MCTVVARWSGGEPIQLLALRDELTSRAFDDPGAWWPDQPDVIGGRDQLAGGTWCATRVTTGVTALVLNRPQKRDADPGAASRGRLPLVAVQHQNEWSSHINLEGMASFLLLSAAPDGLTSWDFDGRELTRTDHAPGTAMFTSGGAEDGKAERYLSAFAAASFPDGWRALVQQAPPADDPAALVVRHAEGDQTFATVFGQLIEASPGHLVAEYSRRPWNRDPWQHVESRQGLEK